MLILVNRVEEKLSVHSEIAKFLTVYRVWYTPIETLKHPNHWTGPCTLPQFQIIDYIRILSIGLELACNGG